MNIMASEDEYLSNVHFQENFKNPKFIKTVLMAFERSGDKLKWEMLIVHDSVACVLYHRIKKLLLFVKQFRPAVFVAKIRSLPENSKKTFHEIDWSKYPISMGETIELCAGIVDKPNLDINEHIKEEIIEECGYNVPINQIKLIKTFVTGVGSNGSKFDLFFAEIDDSMKMSDANCVGEETIEKIWMTVQEAKNYTEVMNSMSPPSLLYALLWFFNFFKDVESCD